MSNKKCGSCKEDKDLDSFRRIREQVVNFLERYTHKLRSLSIYAT